MTPGANEKKFLQQTEKRSSWLYQLHVICMTKASSLVGKETESSG